MNKADKAAGIVEYGVFVWSGDQGAYQRANAIKVYRSRSAADRYASAHNLVARGLDKNGRLTFAADLRPEYQQPKRR